MKFIPFEGGDSLPSGAIEHLIIRQNEYLYTYNTSICVENLQFIDKVMDLTGVNEDPYQTSIVKCGWLKYSLAMNPEFRLSNKSGLKTAIMLCAKMSTMVKYDSS